jgi:hypothetical protein
MKDIICIDNALPPRVFNRILNIVSDSRFFWSYAPSTAREKAHKPSEGFVDDFSFAHNIYRWNPQKGVVHQTETFNIFDFAFLSLIDSSAPDLNIKNLLRIRVGMITRKDTIQIHPPHVDSVEPHMTGLFYLTTSNAPTYFYKEIYDPASNMKLKDYENIVLGNKFNVETTIDSIENRFVLFNGSRYHSSSTPTDVDRRMAINFNFTL